LLKRPRSQGGEKVSEKDQPQRLKNKKVKRGIGVFVEKPYVSHGKRLLKPGRHCQETQPTKENCGR